MAYNVPGVSVVATKMASGTVKLEFYDLIYNQSATYQGPVSSSVGSLRFAVVIPSADFTSFNTTVNGGSTGANLTKNYAQDANQGDYSSSTFTSRV